MCAAGASKFADRLDNEQIKQVIRSGFRVAGMCFRGGCSGLAQIERPLVIQN
jgi:hypothetical protein